MGATARCVTQEALLGLLKELLDLPALDPRQALTDGATSVARWFGCEKVDVFLFDEARSSLSAIGTSATPLGELQRKLGLDVMPLAQGGRAVEVYTTGRAHVDGHVDADSKELRGIVNDLSVRSQAAFPLDIGGVRRGVLSLVSQEPARFDFEDTRSLELVANSMGALAHRSELVERLAEAERQRGRRMAADEVVMVLAHDVSNHLNPLSARLELLRLRAARSEPIEPAQLDSALLRVRRLARLAQDLLDSARLEQGLFELRLAPIDLSQLVRDVADVCSTPTVKVRVEAPSGLIGIADGERLRQALENIILNGIRYSPPGAPLDLTVDPAAATSSVTIRIRDTGPGIRKELLPHLFDRFVADGRRRGVGLGLYLACQVARAHGGRLEVKSQLGVGSEFMLTVPLDGPR